MTQKLENQVSYQSRRNDASGSRSVAELTVVLCLLLLWLSTLAFHISLGHLDAVERAGDAQSHIAILLTPKGWHLSLIRQDNANIPAGWYVEFRRRTEADTTYGDTRFVQVVRDVPGLYVCIVTIPWLMPVVLLIVCLALHHRRRLARTVQRGATRLLRCSR